MLCAWFVQFFRSVRITFAHALCNDTHTAVVRLAVTVVPHHSPLPTASLAYLTAKTHGLQEEAEEIASSLNVPPDQVLT